MSKQYYSVFDRWTLCDYQKLQKIRNVILQFTRGGRTNDIPIVMSQLPHESTTSLYKFNSEELHNSINTPKESNETPSEGNTLAENKKEHSTQISINLDSISNSDLNTIEIDGFKFHIRKYIETEIGERSEMIKVKIILPKGTSYNFDKENIDEEVKDPPKGKALKPEDFLALNEKFVAFANSLIDTGSLNFIPDDLTCSSPSLEVDEDGIELEESPLNLIPPLEESPLNPIPPLEGSPMNTLPQLEEQNNDVPSKMLNNSFDVPNDKDVKLVEFIDNISTETLESFPNEPNCLNSLESTTEQDTLIENKNESHEGLLSQVSKRLQYLKDNSPKRRIIYYDDIKKRNFYNRNITNSAPNINCDYKFIKPPKTDPKDPTFEVSQKESCNDPPIMGKNALLAKLNVVNQQMDNLNNNTDSKIIEDIVNDRFRDFLTEHYRRNMKRKARKNLFCEDKEENDSNNSNLAFSCGESQDVGEIVFENNESENTAVIVENGNLKHNHLIPEIRVTIDESKPSSNDQIQEERRIESGAKATDETFAARGSSLKINNLANIQIYSPLSSTTTLASRDFGEFIENGLFDINQYLNRRHEYDPQIFLQTALGEELDRSATTFYAEPFERTCLSMNALLSIFTVFIFAHNALHCTHKHVYVNLVQKFAYKTDPCSTYTARSQRAISGSHSVGSSEVSLLISAASMRSLSETRAKNFRKSMGDIDEEMERSSSMSDIGSKTNEELLSDLLKESAIQFQIIQQTTKALDLCRSVKEFVSSPEQIEAEKILLTATCQREAVLQEIRRLQMGETPEEVDYPGFIRLSNLKFPAKSFGCHANDSTKKKDYTQWFVCIISCGTKVYATDTAIADFEGNVCFHTQVSFDNLKPDFEISVTIYAMKVKNNLRTYSHESKYHLNKRSKTTCPSPTKLLTFSRHRSTPRLPEACLKPSNFTLWGTGTIKICDLGKRTSFQMKNVPMCSTLYDEFLADIESFIDIKEHFSGFLHVGAQTNSDFVSWNRRWCTLNDTELLLWTDPIESGNPVDIIDLKTCINSWISVVERSICARPKTLLLETRNANRQIIRYLLNADTFEDMKKWENVLNSVVSALRTWNCIKYPPFSEFDETSLSFIHKVTWFRNTMFKFLLITACAFAAANCEKREIPSSDNDVSAGTHLETIALIDAAGHGGYGGGGKIGFSVGSGLKAIALGSAEQANTAVVNQHTAARQAAFAAKSTLAQAAAGAAATAQAALVGKQILVQRLQADVQEAQSALQAEIQQLQQAQRSAASSQQAAQLAQQQLNALNAALNAAQGTVTHAQQAAEESGAEYGAQQAMVGAAKQRLSTLTQQLHAAQVDYQATQAAAQTAEAAAQVAQSNAAHAADAASESASASGLGHAISAGALHGFVSEGYGGYH
ncbi:hypothetical protein Trydic_g1157 [Trypoxylus dichotomus]